MTVTHRYTAASDGWLAFITPARQLFVGAPLDAGAVDRLWTRIRDERGPAGVLEALTAGGLFATPPFAFVEQGDGAVDVIVRGDAVVHSGAEQVSGSGAATWIERRLPGGSVGVTLAGSGSGELPIEAGVVRASAFATGSAAPGTVRGSAAAPAPVVAPAPQQPATADTEIVEITIPPFAQPPEETVAAGDAYDYLFGETMYRSVEDAAVRAEPPAEEPAEPAAPVEDGDHDGSTVLASSITRSGRTRRTRRESPAAPAAPRVVVVLPSGVREPLDQALVLGRSPSVAGVPGGQLPRLVTISGGDQDISRSHVRIALEGGTVVVTDLHSRNGTTIVAPSGESQKLRGGEPTPVIVGTVVDLGGGVELTVEEV
ncbi:MAG: FHA domain-containing protein [Protaetiibacter sp.]